MCTYFANHLWELFEHKILGIKSVPSRLIERTRFELQHEPLIRHISDAEGRKVKLQTRNRLMD